MTLSALVIVFGRSTFAFLTLYLVLRLKKAPIRVVGLKGILLLMMSGALLALHWWSFFYSIKISTVAIGLLTFSSFPLFVTFLEPWVFREKLRSVDIGTALSIGLGLVIVIPAFDFANQITQGVFWGTISGATFAGISVANRHLVHVHQPITVAFFQNLSASCFLFPALFFTEFQFTALDYVLLPIMGILCTGIAFGLYVKSLGFLKAQLVGIIMALEPVYGILFSFLILGEIPALRTIVGGAVILGTIGLATVLRPKIDDRGS